MRLTEGRLLVAELCALGRFNACRDPAPAQPSPRSGPPQFEVSLLITPPIAHTMEPPRFLSNIAPWGAE